MACGGEREFLGFSAPFQIMWCGGEGALTRTVIWPYPLLFSVLQSVGVERNRKGGLMIRFFLRLFFTASVLWGGYIGSMDILMKIEKAFILRIKKGFSSSEGLARQLTGKRLPY